MTLLCLICAVVAFACFGLATDAHHQQRLGFRAEPARRRNLKRSAWAAVMACGILGFAAKGPVYGAIFWIGALSFGAAAVFLFLNFTPANRPPLTKPRRSK